MADRTSIEWCDRTWSPWEGCTKVSDGCTNCYAAARNGRFAKGSNWGPGAPRRLTADWTKPLLWNRRAARDGIQLRVFPSICDPFDNEVDPAWRARFFALIGETPHLTWLLLTKRIGNVTKMIEAPGMQKCGLPPNVWLGATVVNQEEADRDIPKLLATPARVRFLSVEPMLGPIDMLPWLRSDCWYGSRPGPGGRGGVTCQDCNGLGHQCRRLQWVIVGGESGPKARDFDIGWARSIVAQCKAAGVPVLVKQLGARPVWSDSDEDSEPPHWGRISYADKKGGDWSEWPADIRIREFPHVDA